MTLMKLIYTDREIRSGDLKNRGAIWLVFDFPHLSSAYSVPLRWKVLLLSLLIAVCQIQHNPLEAGHYTRRPAEIQGGGFIGWVVVIRITVRHSIGDHDCRVSFLPE